MRSYIFRFLSLFLLVTSFTAFLSCKRTYNPIDGNADFWIDDVISDPQYSSLRAVFGAMNFTGGVGGVLVIRISGAENIDDYSAFDRACPYEANGIARVTWDKKDPLYAVCPTCKSKFNLISRTVESGPSEYPLYTYECEYLGGSIHVY